MSNLIEDIQEKNIENTLRKLGFSEYDIRLKKAVEGEILKNPTSEQISLLKETVKDNAKISRFVDMVANAHTTFYDKGKSANGNVLVSLVNIAYVEHVQETDEKEKLKSSLIEDYMSNYRQ